MCFFSKESHSSFWFPRIPLLNLSELVGLYFSSGLFLRFAGWLHGNLITSESTEGKYQAIYGERLWSSRLFIKGASCSWHGGNRDPTIHPTHTSVGVSAGREVWILEFANRRMASRTLIKKRLAETETKSCLDRL